MGTARRLISVELVEIRLVAVWISLDGLAARVPVRGADVAVLLGELERVEQTQCLVDAAANREIVNGDLRRRYQLPPQSHGGEIVMG